MTEPEQPPLDPAYFTRPDDAADEEFYSEPRMVAHLDDPARAALAEAYASRMTRGGHVLDLMASLYSHLPEHHGQERVVGLGMNEDELRANKQLTERLVHNLNTDPSLPFEDANFDACLIALSVQYLIQPMAVFADVGRVLKPGGLLMVSFSNRCFPTKAVAIWQATDDKQHAGLVRLYFERAGGFGEPATLELSPAPGESDPLWMVVARRERAPVRFITDDDDDTIEDEPPADGAVPQTEDES